MISRTCLIVADGLAICATWSSLYKRHYIRHGVAFKGTISSVLLVDGMDKLGPCLLTHNDANGLYLRDNLFPVSCTLSTL